MTATSSSTPLRRLTVVAAGVLALLATACGGSGSGSTTAAPAAGSGGKKITISNFEFSPEVLQAKVGDVITVENKDSAEHSVTATDGSFDTGRFAGGTKTFTVSKAGRIEFECNVHPFMTHKVIQVAG